MPETCRPLLIAASIIRAISPWLHSETSSVTSRQRALTKAKTSSSVMSVHPTATGQDPSVFFQAEDGIDSRVNVPDRVIARDAMRAGAHGAFVMLVDSRSFDEKRSHAASRALSLGFADGRAGNHGAHLDTGGSVYL